MQFEREFIVIAERLQIRYYGIIIVAAMLVAASVATRLVRRGKGDPDHVWGALTWGIIPGIIGARLWFVLFPSNSLVAEGITRSWMLNHPLDLDNGPLAVWNGGLGIFGAVLGGLLGVYIYMRRNNLPLAAWLDVAGVTLPLAQSIGRWANFVNQELYGKATSLPWGISIDAAHRVDPYDNIVEYPTSGVNVTHFHPLFLYESLWNLLAFIILLNVYLRRRRSLHPGDIFLMYVAQYSAIRFLLEFIRVDIPTVGGINTSQATTGILFVVTVLLLIYRFRARPASGQNPSLQSYNEQAEATAKSG